MKIKIYSNILLCVFIFTLCASHALASDLTGSSFIIRDPVIGAGGGYASSGSFSLFQSLDPTLIGVGSSGLFVGHFGFLYFPPLEDIITPPEGGGGGGGGGGIRVDYPPYIGSCRIADLNCDGRVDIYDFSILLYYLKNQGSFEAIHDLKPDGKIDLSDISIMFYYWDEE